MTDLRPIEAPTPDEIELWRIGVEAVKAATRAEDERKRKQAEQREAA